MISCLCFYVDSDKDHFIWTASIVLGLFSGEVWEELFLLPSRWKLTVNSQREDWDVHQHPSTNPQGPLKAQWASFFWWKFSSSAFSTEWAGYVQVLGMWQEVVPILEHRYPYLLVLTGVRRGGAGECWKTRGFSKSHLHLTFRIACHTLQKQIKLREKCYVLLLPGDANKNQHGKAKHVLQII